MMPNSFDCGKIYFAPNTNADSATSAIMITNATVRPRKRCGLILVLRVRDEVFLGRLPCPFHNLYYIIYPQITQYPAAFAGGIDVTEMT